MIEALVLGANGQLGRKLTSKFSQNGISCIGLGRNELDFKNLKEIENVLGKFNVDLIVNCAAITDVNWAETNEDETYLINAKAVERIGRFANSAGSRLIHISSDYVFEGRELKFNKEDDPTSPLSVYGKSKLRGEESLQGVMGSDLAIIRTGGLYGGHQSNLVNYVLTEIRAKREVRLPIDQYYQPTNVHDLANVIFGIAMDPSIYGVFHSTSNGSVSKFDFARRIALHNKLDPKFVLGVPFRSMNNSNIRPQFSLLSSKKLEIYGNQSIGFWDKDFIN